LAVNVVTPYGTAVALLHSILFHVEWGLPHPRFCRVPAFSGASACDLSLISISQGRHSRTQTK